MLFKHLSIPELNFHSSWSVGWNKIQNLNNFDKYITIVWFLGPFIYLIERDPADLWLTLLSLVFIIRCIIKKDWSWSSQFWFKCALALWLFGMFSAVLGPEPLFSFQQGFVWIRFPLYAAAAQVWIAKDRDIRIIMSLCILIGMLIMSAILISESIIDPKTRLTWPYGDLIPGAYLTRFSLPFFCVLMAITANKKNISGLLAGLLSLLFIIVSGLTGERGNFLIIVCGGILATVIWRPKRSLIFTIIIVQSLSVLALALVKPDLSKRFTVDLYNKIPIINSFSNNENWGAWRSGIQQGLETPIKGIGPSGTRKNCKKLEPNLHNWLPGNNYCGNHPHNFYIQLFAEVGIIGLLIGILMFSGIIFTCFKARRDNPNCPIAATAFIVPLAFFFPIQQVGSFYSQWGNLFIWFAIGYSISQFQGWKKN